MESAVSKSDKTGDLSHMTLSDLIHQVGQVLRKEFNQRYWFTCDIDSLKRSSVGHVYLTLGHKNEAGQKSSVKAIIWQNDIDLISKFEFQTGIRFAEHISVMFLGEVTFSPQYGLSIKVVDINSTYSVGHFELKIRQIRDQLNARGYSNLNRVLPTPQDFTRVAVIAPSNAAGLQDFKTKADLLSERRLCQFDYFVAMFQGERRIDTISAAFSELVHNEYEYDAVCVIRGGGDAASLNELAEWKLALMVCKCPYPLFTGIGHESDEILLDEYSNRSFATPSMVANHIFNTIVQNANSAKSAFDFITNTAKLKVANQKQDCERLMYTVFDRKRVVMSTWRAEIEKQSDKLFNMSKQSVSNAKFSVGNDFNRLLSFSKKAINEQKQMSNRHHESLRIGAYRAVQDAKSEVKNLKVTMDGSSQASIDHAKQEVIRSFNTIQLSSTRLVADQKNAVLQLWREIHTAAISQINTAKQYASHDLMSVVSNAKRHTAATNMEVSSYWYETKKSASSALDKSKDKVINEYKVIDAYDPQRTLERGYSIVYSADGEVLTEAGDAVSGRQIKVRMKDGAFDAKVD
ncbi:exodeoxyribonuclease VII large subunit [Vibrio parahaemolyticus]|uniref:exodeoxyribonuclease VII large subunit n=1 Tax=Vibrio parahaemolyticus TaxID=670 RepID=UPI001121C7B6|nr:exodeoxyribonuclease VII large subunit [Vibrio parahaemolyticus]TOB71879.1 hypothetical protein CGK00_23455 [Vibrio parahaemolyticus]